MRKELNEMLLLGIMLGMVITSAIFMSLNIGNVNQKEQKQEQVFVWNDDIESVPLNGYVKIDGVVNDTIYLSPDE
jgi:predicted ATP-grasp superfamily ATP-dependent carboligase